MIDLYDLPYVDSFNAKECCVYFTEMLYVFS